MKYFLSCREVVSFSGISRYLAVQFPPFIRLREVDIELSVFYHCLASREQGTLERILRNSLTLNYSGDTNIWQDYSYQKSVPKWRVAVRLLRIGISLPRKISVM